MYISFYVLDWVGDGFWLGLNDEAAEGDFRWEHDGMTPHFTAWGSSEPNGGTYDNCVMGRSIYTWNDAPCSVSTNVICEF